MNFITLKGRNFNLDTVQEYTIEEERTSKKFTGKITLDFIRGSVTLKYNNTSEFSRDKCILLDKVAIPAV